MLFLQLWGAACGTGRRQGIAEAAGHVVCFIFVSSCADHAAPSPAQWDEGISSAPCPEQEEGSKITRVGRGRLSSS